MTAVELHDFVQKTIEQIIGGVKDSQEIAKAAGARVADVGWVTNIEFDVAITTTDNSERKGGAGIFIAGFGIGGSGKTEASTTAVSRVKFIVPISLPKDRA